MTEQKLKPCPFCGGEATSIEKYDYSSHPWHWIECTGCDARTDNYLTEKEAIEAWNKRVGEVDWFQSLPTKDKEKLFKYISEKCQKCGEENDKRYKR